jgi:hypothetical protein
MRSETGSSEQGVFPEAGWTFGDICAGRSDQWSLARTDRGRQDIDARPVSGGQAASTTGRGDSRSGKRVMQRAPAQ